MQRYKKYENIGETLLKNFLKDKKRDNIVLKILFIVFQ